MIWRSIDRDSLRSYMVQDPLSALLKYAASKNDFHASEWILTEM